MKYKINISNGCTAGGHLEVNGISYSGEDDRYALSYSDRKKFQDDLFIELRRMLNNYEMPIQHLVELLHVEDQEYLPTCETCGDNMVTTYYEFENIDTP